MLKTLYAEQKKRHRFIEQSFRLCGVFVFILFFLFFPDYVALWDSKTPHRPTYERVPYCLETSPLSRLSPQNGSLSLNLLSVFVFCILSYLPLNRTGCLSGCLVSSASVQKLFCGSFSAFRSFDEFWGEKGVSPTYPSAIMGHPKISFLNFHIYKGPNVPKHTLIEDAGW